jgi:hypothetical protein
MWSSFVNIITITVLQYYVITYFICICCIIPTRNNNHTNSRYNLYILLTLYQHNKTIHLECLIGALHVWSYYVVKKF